VKKAIFHLKIADNTMFFSEYALEMGRKSVIFIYFGVKNQIMQ